MGPHGSSLADVSTRCGIINVFMTRKAHRFLLSFLGRQPLSLHEHMSVVRVNRLFEATQGGKGPSGFKPSVIYLCTTYCNLVTVSYTVGMGTSNPSLVPCCPIHSLQPSHALKRNDFQMHTSHEEVLFSADIMQPLPTCGLLLL
jgi:hypothetical protein